MHNSVKADRSVPANDQAAAVGPDGHVLRITERNSCYSPDINGVIFKVQYGIFLTVSSLAEDGYRVIVLLFGEGCNIVINLRLYRHLVEVAVIEQEAVVCQFNA